MSNPPQRFRPYNTPDDESRPDAKTRKIDSPASSDQDDSWQQMVNPDWRAPRRRASPRASASASRMRMPDPQRIGTWMNQGGTRIIIGVAAAVVILFVLLLVYNIKSAPTETAGVNQPSSELPGITNQQPTAPIIVGTGVPNPATTGQQPPAVPPTSGEQPAAPQPGGNAQRLVVTNTGVEGLFLREQPSTGANILKTLPEGTQVEKLGEQDADGRRWLNVRDVESSLVGWAAADFLLPAP